MTSPTPTATTVEPHKRLTPEQRSSLGLELKAKYESGATLRELSEQSGRSFGWIHKVLEENGTQMRPRGGNHAR